MMRPLLILLALLLNAAPASAAKPLFESAAPLAISIEAPLERLLHNRDSDAPVAGTLVDNLGNRMPINVELRGITRRREETCAFPPLSVRFTAAPPAASPFAGERKLKLVTHCLSNTSSDRVVLLEYAAYRMYQALTPRSFGVRLLNVRYIGANGRPIAQRPAFVIEDLSDVARRNQLAELRVGPRIPIADLNRADAARYALFQHMLANHDWSMRAGPAGDNCCHNARLIGSAGPGNATPIPYDFDFSGFVNAPYAKPPEQLGLGSVRDRRYRGYCSHNAEAAEAVRQFRARQGAMEAALAAVPGLDARAMASARAFMQQFFAQIATDQSAAETVLKRCVG